MMKSGLLILLLIFVSFPTSSIAEIDEYAMYLDRETHEGAVFDQGEVSIGRFRENRPPSGDAKLFDPMPGSVLQANSCSTGNVSCIMTGSFVFAIPNDRLYKGRKYTASGAYFDVIDCLSQSIKCNVFLIYGKCRYYFKEKCYLNKPNEAAIPGGRVAFIFKPRSGIISLGLGIDDEDPRIIAQKYPLVFGRGILLLK